MGWVVPVAQAVGAVSSSGGLMTALKFGSAFGAIMMGKATQDRYNTMAKYRMLEGRVEAVQANEKGNEVLRRINVALADNIALTGAAGFNMADATVQGRMNFGVMRPGSIEFSTAKSNQDVAMIYASRDANDMRAAGRQAFMGGIVSAMGTLASGGMDAAQIGTAPAGAVTSSYGPRLVSAPTFSNPMLSMNLRPQLTAGGLFR